MTKNEGKALSLRRISLDAWEHYERSLYSNDEIKWDYIILTASDRMQAEAYEQQIRCRLERGLLPVETVYGVVPDPGGERVGSGGATLNVLRYLAEQNGGAADLKDKKILVIHSGGDSKRVPQYSAVGKLFSPAPRELPNGAGSTLFDELVIGMSGVPARIREGMLVLSGDVLLQFDPQQIELSDCDAAAISMKAPAVHGENHGVFLNDGQGNVEAFLHKQPEGTLRSRGAVDGQGNVDLDTGAVLLSVPVLKALFSLICTDGRLDELKFGTFVSGETPISFYGDFLYPMAKAATLEQYYREGAEGAMTEKLLACRTRIWEVLSGFCMKLLCLVPADFIHFGTTWELRRLLTADMENYEYLGWRHRVMTFGEGGFTANTAYIDDRATVEPGACLEYCCVLGGSHVEAGAVVSNLLLQNAHIGPNAVLHGLPQRDGTFVARIYGVTDNPKLQLASGAALLGTQLQAFLDSNGLTDNDLWDSEEKSLWSARLYPACKSPEEALAMALTLQRMAQGTAAKEEIRAWKNTRRESLRSSFQGADVHGIYRWQQELELRIRCGRFVEALKKGVYYRDALAAFGGQGVTELACDLLLDMAQGQPTGIKMRICYALSRFMQENQVRFHGCGYEAMEAMCFGSLQRAMCADAILDRTGCRIRRDCIKIELPVRVNWGGGWTDTPPYCIEHGGAVLNAAIKVNDTCPVSVEIRRLEPWRMEFESGDGGVFGTVTSVAEIRDCSDPYDPFALHKAALIASGLIPLTGEADLQQILQMLGGGIRISTQVKGIPKGSGLGTSSILAGACMKGLYEFLGLKCTLDTVSRGVLVMEQLMTTGGGWQDQAGGLVEGVKLITTEPGPDQTLTVEKLDIRPEVFQQLQQRFTLIYTGQRRLARDLLRKVVGNYLGNRRETLEALRQMGPLTVQMKQALERGDIDAFAGLLDRQWELSRRLDPAATNACIDRIFLACGDLIDGRLACGAGGGGFLQVILKKGVTRRQLRQRLAGAIPDGSVDVWETEFV